MGLLRFLRKASFFPLPNRELISLRGCATIDFLQGLMTNDARLIEPKNSLIYSLFLNVKGRVIGDTLIYHVNHQDQEEPHFVIECDSKCKPSVLKLLRYYDIRKKASLLRRVIGLLIRCTFRRSRLCECL